MIGISMKDIDNRFTYHPPQKGEPAVYEDIRETGKRLALKVIRHTRPSREQALAITKIEEAVMWANAARARHGAPEGEEEHE